MATSEQNKAMAAHMKAQGIKRTTGNCPMCHNRVSLGSMYNHILGCKAESKR